MRVFTVLNSPKVKKIANVTVKNYLNESLLSPLCFIIYGQGPFESILFLIDCDENFLLLFLKTGYQYFFTFASIFVFHKAS